MREKEALQGMQILWKVGKDKSISARGTLGGLCKMWSTKVLNLVDCFQAPNWLMVTLSMISTCMTLSIINVYMLNNYFEKSECWGSLLYLEKGNLPQNLIIMGYFNITRSLKEK
jgi:hypothetical protein